MNRLLTIVADDYGIGEETSRGILELACEQRISGTVLMVNCQDSVRAVRAWQQSAPLCDLGWHPNLTLDFPICSPNQIPSLVRADGSFWPLKPFLKRVLCKQIRQIDVIRELTAQYHRFLELTGHPPQLVNSHQHVSLFAPCANALLMVLEQFGDAPYVRRVQESLRTLTFIRNSWLKRVLLTCFGKRNTSRLRTKHYPGCELLIGITDPEHVQNPHFWEQWFRHVGNHRTVEICCHPGYYDNSLLGRDVDKPIDLDRRPSESLLLKSPHFREIYLQAGFQLVRPSAILL